MPNQFNDSCKTYYLIIDHNNSISLKVLNSPIILINIMGFSFGTPSAKLTFHHTVSGTFDTKIKWL